MAKTQVQATTVNAVAVSTGAGTTTTTASSVAASYQTLYTIWIANDVSNGPSTTVGSVQIEVGPTATDLVPWMAPIKGYSTANTTRKGTVVVPMGATYTRVVYGGNVGGGDVTYTIKETQVTSI